MKTSPAHDLDDPLAPEDETSRQALALLWLAESSPLTAAPPDTLTNVRVRLGPDISRPAPRLRWRIIALSGWAAAAACLAVLLWKNTALPVPGGNPATTGTRKNPAMSPHPAVNPAAPAKEAGTVQPLTDPADLRRQLAELRAALVASNQQTPGTHRPVIRELRPPNASGPAISQDHILDVIATALESDLNRRSPFRGNSREVIIESGWANWSAALPADATFRHRQFPATRWQELGLLKGEGGRFFDPATGWLWSPDPDSTDYTGQMAPADLDRSRFAGSAFAAEKQSAAIPAGYLITAGGGETIVALNSLPSIPEGATLTLNAFSQGGEMLRYNVDNSTLTSLSATDGWNFSGLIPAGRGADFGRGFSLELQSSTGDSTVILRTPQDPAR